MPAYKKDGYGGDDRGGVRYRGRGRGGFGRAGRDSGGGGGRGYGRGGGSYDRDRYKWNDRGGRHEGSGGYRDRGYGQNRFRDGPGGRNQGGSWNRGSGSGSAHMDRGRASDFYNPLSQLRGKETEIAMSIVNAVLASSQNSSGGIGRSNWYDGSPRKMRHMDWDGVRSPPMHKYNQRDFRIVKGYRGSSGYAKAPMDYRKMSKSQLRKIEMARLEMPQPEKKESKDSEKKVSATEVKEGEQERASAEESGPPADADGKQSDSADASEKEVDADDAEMKDVELEDKEEIRQEEGQQLEEEEGQQIKQEEKQQINEEEKQQVKPERQHTKQENSKTLSQEDENQEDTSVIIPRATLMCHMCDMTKFPNTKAYLSHLESKNHEMMARTFHNRNGALVDVLMADSRLVCMRMPKKRSGYSHCPTCHFPTNTSIQEHFQTTEHTLVSQFSRVRCCSNRYNRMILEEHRLSLRHLKNQWDIEQETQKKIQKEEEEERERLESDASFHKEVYRLKTSNDCEEELTPATLPPFDPDKFIGLNYLYKEKLYRCDLCRSELRNPKHTEYHFRSIDHYYNLCRHLTEEEEKKELERKKLEEANKEQEELKIRENNGDENDSCEDMNNMETVDEALEDADMDAQAGGSHAQVSADDRNEGASSAADTTRGLKRSSDNQKQLQQQKNEEEQCAGSENNQEEADEEEAIVFHTKTDVGDDEEVMDEEGLDYEPGVGV